jgi:hypothetical protein
VRGSLSEEVLGSLDVFCELVEPIQISMEEIRSKWERFGNSTSLMSYVPTGKAKEDLPETDG